MLNKRRKKETKVGYVRVSTIDQNLDLQIDALKAYGCDKIFQDKLSGVKDKRPGLEEALQYVRPGDSLVVWRLDRLGRTMRHLIHIVNELNERKLVELLHEQGDDLVVDQRN